MYGGYSTWLRRESCTLRMPTLDSRRPYAPHLHLSLAIHLLHSPCATLLSGGLIVVFSPGRSMIRSLLCRVVNNGREPPIRSARHGQQKEDSNTYETIPYGIGWLCTVTYTVQPHQRRQRRRSAVPHTKACECKELADSCKIIASCEVDSPSRIL